MSQLKILVVEDDPMIAESVQDILAILKHEVIGVAENAEDAIAICNETLPDLALLDIQIGGDIDGVDLADLLNQNFQIPFIFTTAVPLFCPLQLTFVVLTITLNGPGS